MDWQKNRWMDKGQTDGGSENHIDIPKYKIRDREIDTHAGD
jgi:hypothetical protein